MQTEYFITSGGIAISKSFPTWEAARAALLQLVEEGAGDLEIESSEIEQGDGATSDFREVLDHPMNRGRKVRREWLAAR